MRNPLSTYTFHEQNTDSFEENDIGFEMFLEVPKLDNQTDLLAIDGVQSWKQKTNKNKLKYVNK